MTTYTLAGSFGWAGGGKAGAIVDIWATSRFGGQPAEGQSPPSGNPDAGPVTTGPNYGSPGAYVISGIVVLQDYYVRIQYGGLTFWGERTAASLGGLGGGGDVLTVFGRTGNVIGQSGDYTAAEVGADVSGAAATAQANAETYADTNKLAKSANLNDVANASTARTNLGLGTAATQASSAFDSAGAAAAAEAAAKAASLPLAGGSMAGTINANNNPITGVSDLAMHGLTGATAASRFVGATTSGAPVSGTFSTLDWIIDGTGNVWVCTAGGSPGTWQGIGIPTGAWTSFTPTWTSSGTAPTLGNGTLTGFYQKFGRQVSVRINLTAGSTTTYGSGNYVFQLPFTSAATTGQILTAYFNDATAQWAGIGVLGPSATTVIPYTNSGGSGGDMVLFGATQLVAAAQVLQIQGVYESLT